MSTSWLRSEHETASLRETLDCAPDACVFRRGDLMAVVFCDDQEPNAWHMYLAAKNGKRIPKLDEIIEARDELLPGIEDFAVAPVPGIGIPVLHLVELREGTIRRLS